MRQDISESSKQKPQLAGWGKYGVTNVIMMN